MLQNILSGVLGSCAGCRFTRTHRTPFVLMVIVHTVKEYRLESLKGKSLGNAVQEKQASVSKWSFLVELQEATLTLPAVICDSVCKELPIRDAYRHLGVRDLLGGSHVEKQHACVWLLCLPEQTLVITINLIVKINLQSLYSCRYSRAQGFWHTKSHQVEYFELRGCFLGSSQKPVLKTDLS